ncbi:hypothetical protein M406DRAFT_82026 [Cryphonectria parasitica EP155]|uniref:Spermatogenesis-associated protein 20-like TRX domain-containing protein n=1 Tax=Cryphonectria parasitica (strain ATCC 38755 / EP155) TaxID=660469 RepID=A0A9P5CT47_CRYP1|nr:uncharacterized protein M406DRAFT_82026 [Cryphonectria parasitica EP155]KAF3768785.1 hypothetical protein M406DRAFT_82026 [Cryphonectria parasitica EP155]
MRSQLKKPSSASSRDAELSAQFSQASLSGLPPLQNRAAQSSSPYVRAHASSPVAWQLLDDEATQRAKKENKLVFMNIGFKSCHYCHLTTTESFTHPEVARLLNKCFIPVVVDRDERPDIDNIYMNYIQAINGSGGWPLNVFLTSDLEPVFGGTYWPSPGTELVGIDGEEVSEDERLDFLVILQKMRDVWPEHEARCRQEAKEIVSKLREFAAEGTLGTRGVVPPDLSGSPMAADSDLDLDQLEEAYTHIAGTFDPVNGGFGVAPKFPTPAKLSFLLKLTHFPPSVADVVGEKEVTHATHMALLTLRKLRDGGLRDHVGGGFHRYSVTANWSMPHFEKMVSDNALLLGVYLDAWLSTAAKKSKIEKEDEFANVVFELAEYLTAAPIQRPDGGFVCGEAADSYYRKGDAHMREGAYYLWTRREFDQALTGLDSQVSAVAAAHWKVLEHGNVDREQDPIDEFINQNVLYTVKDAKELGQQFGISPEETQKLIEVAREKLKAHREKDRVRPETDDKVVTSTNAMVISALARTSSAVKSISPVSAEKYLKAAINAADFIRGKLWDDSTKTLFRSYSTQRSTTQAFAEDYAFLVEALLDLYETTGNESWLQWADALQKTQIDLFYDPTVPSTSRPVTPMAHHSACGGFYSTTDEASHVILRLKDGMDTAQPSTNAISASNLFRLGVMLGDTHYTKLARETINAFEVEALQYPWLFIGLLGGVVTARLGGIVWVTKADKDEEELRRKFYELPRAGLRSLVLSQGGDWLGSTRNNKVAQLGEGTYVFDGEYQPFKED